MLEGPRAGEVAVLRHVSREQDGDALLFGQTDEGVGAQTHLGGAAGYLGPRRVADGLDRVHRQEERASVAGGLEHARQVSPGTERDGVTRHAQPAGPCGDLGVRLLAGDHDTAVSFRREMREHMQQQRRLPDPRLAGEEGHRRRDQAATKHPVHAGEADGDTSLIVG